MLDEHDAEPALRVVDASNGEGSAINSDIAFRDKIRQKRWACGSRFRQLEGEALRVPVRGTLNKRGRRIDMSLDSTWLDMAEGGEWIHT